MNFREITVTDSELQKSLLFVALWTPDDEPDHDMKVLELPHIKEYFDDWGQEGDFGLFALDDTGGEMGIVQVRYKSSLTECHADCPELALAVNPLYRGQGVASVLMRELLVRTDNLEVGVRLGVHPKNKAAISLYEKFGFETYQVVESGYLQMYRGYQPVAAL